MRFLTDQDVYAITNRFLSGLGHDVVTAAQLGLAQAEDLELLRVAQDQGRIFVTRDRDFGGLVFVLGGCDRAVPGIMRLFWAFSPSNPPESPSQEESSLANMPDTLEARCRSDGPPAGPRSIDPLPGSRSFLTVSAVA